jgi:hypothetical protein
VDFLSATEMGSRPAVILTVYNRCKCGLQQTSAPLLNPVYKTTPQKPPRLTQSSCVTRILRKHETVGKVRMRACECLQKNKSKAPNKSSLNMENTTSASHSRGPGSRPCQVIWGFVVDKVAQGQVFSEYFGFPCQSFHRLLHTRHHPGLIQ